MVNQKVKKASETLDTIIIWLAIFLVTLIPLFFWPQSTSSQYPLLWIYLIPKVVLLRVGSYLIAFFWLLRTVLRLLTRDLSWRPSAAQLFALLFLLGLRVVSFFALNKEFALYGSLFWLEGFYTYANYIFLFLLATVFGSVKAFSRLVKLLTITTIIIAAYAVVEAYYPAVQTFTNVGFAGRSGATAGNAVILGAYLVLPFALISGFLLHNLYQQKFWRYAGFVSLSLTVAALAFTFSRGAWLGAAVGLLLLLALSRKQLVNAWITKKLAIVLLLIFTAVVIYFGPRATALVPRAFSAFNPTEATVQARVVLWRQALALLKKYPLSGTGIDSFAFATAKHFPKSPVSQDKPHNFFLEVLVTFGLPVGLIFLSWLGYLVFTLARTVSRQAALKPYALVALTAIVSYLTAIFFLFSTPNNAPLFYFLLGLATNFFFANKTKGNFL